MDQSLSSPEPAGLINRWVTPPVGNAVCPFTNLRHSKFYAEFVGKPAIRQVRTGEGKSRGKRLLWLPDIYAELERKAHEQMEAARR